MAQDVGTAVTIQFPLIESRAQGGHDGAPASSAYDLRGIRILGRRGRSPRDDASDPEHFGADVLAASDRLEAWSNEAKSSDKDVTDGSAWPFGPNLPFGVRMMDETSWQR
jgi:hypothetical protein